MASNPFTSADLYKDEGHLDALAKDLIAINAELNKIEKIATSVNKSLSGLSVTKAGDRKELEALDTQIVHLAKSHEALLIARQKTEQQSKKNQQAEQREIMTAEEYLRTMERLKSEKSRQARLTAEQRREERLLQRQTQALAGSYDHLTTSLSINLIRWKALSPAQRANTEEGKRLSATIRQQRNELKALDVQTGTNVRNVGNYRSALGGLGTSLKALVLTYLSLSGAQRLVDVIFGQTKALNSLDVALKLTTGSEIAAAQAKAFLSDLTERLGLDLVKTTRSYLKFGVAAKSIGFTVKETNSIFESFGKVASIIGLRADELDGIFKALEQIMSKGTVQAEEIRGQMGDRLPGAFIILADSMGITTRELNEQLKLGRVLSKEVLPNFARQAEIAYGVQNIDRVDNLAAAQGRFSRSVTLVIEKLESSNVFKDFFNSLTSIFNTIGDNIGTIISLSKTVGILAAAWFTWKLTMIASNAIQKIGIATTVADIGKKGLLAAATGALTRAQQALNLAIKANPIGLLLGTAVALIGVLSQLKDRIDGVRKAQDDLSRARSSASAGVETQRVRIELLTKAYSDETASLEDRHGILSELQKIMPGYLDNLKAEKTSIDDIAKASDEYLKVLEKTLTARALEADLTEAIREQKELERRLDSGDFARGRGAGVDYLADLLLGTASTKEGIENRLKDTSARIEALKTQIGDIGPILEPPESAGDGDSGGADPAKDLLNAFQRRRELNKLIADDRARELDALKIDQDEKIALFKKNGLDTLALTEYFERERKAIIAKFRDLDADEENRIIDIEDGARMRQLESIREFVTNYLAAQKRIAKASSKQANDEYERRATALEVEKDHQMALFDLSEATELEKAQFRIDQEVKLYEDLLALAKTFNKELSKAQVTGIENAIEQLRAKRDSLGRIDDVDIYSLLGIKISDDEKEALNDAFSFAKDQLQSYFDLQRQLTEQAVSDADRRVQSAEAALDRELGLMRDGYANRAENARKELDLAKRQQAEALKLQKRQQIEQLKINTALESSNLIVAIAKVAATVPWPANLIAIATMLGSFTLAKAKAFSLAKKQQFGEGGFEELGGGSHASGKDTDMGFTTKSGRRAHAEAGEGVGIYSRRAMAKYGKEIRHVTTAFNKGVFHDVYMKRQERAIAGLHVVSNQISTQKMESELMSINRTLKAQGRTSSHVDRNGNIVEIRETAGGYRKTIRRQA